MVELFIIHGEMWKFWKKASKRKHPSVKENVDGDFYVEEGCCTMCGVPDSVAPTLFGGFDVSGKATHEQCFVKKQPETPEELKQMLTVLDSQELGCVRYCGKDKKIKERIRGIPGIELIDWD